MITVSDTFSTAMLLISVGVLLAGLGVFFGGFAQFVKSDRDGKGGFFRKG
jgi:hypothetical protein